MNSDQGKTNEIILSGKSSIDIVAQLIKNRQLKTPSKSISWYSKMLGLKSRSNLSEAIRGKRPLKQEHLLPLLQFLDLNNIQQDYVLILREMENSFTKTVEANLERRLSMIKKILESPLISTPKTMRGMNLAHEVYCAISTFEVAPTTEDLRRYFSRELRYDVERAIDFLEKEGLIKIEGQRLVHSSSSSYNIINSKSNPEEEMLYLRERIKSAEQEISNWYKRKNLSFFGNSIISVKKEDYENALTDFKSYILARSLELETENADMLISVNFQIYPLSDHSKKNR